MAKSIGEIRRKSLLIISGAVGGNIVFGGAPKPGAEIPSHIVLTGADFVMCAAIYNEYNGENISEESIIEVLSDAGILLIVAGGGGYAIAKGATGLVAEFTNFLGPIGWIASGLLAAGGTALLGLVWMYICDVAYNERLTLNKAARAIS